jgi:hypothetical protein
VPSDANVRTSTAPSRDQTTDATELFCPACEYSLRGLTDPRCPECGATFDPAELRESTLPWVHRRKVGRVSAFVQTLRLVLFRPRRLSVEMTRPAHFRDAQIFRRVVILIALVSLATWATIYAYHAAGPKPLWPYNVTLYTREHETLLCVVAVALLWLCIALCLFAITGVVTYCFHPRELTTVRQNRAIALAYYTCAPLALTPIVLLIPFVVKQCTPALISAFPDSNLSARLEAMSWFPLIAQAVFVFALPIIVVGIVTRSSTSRMKLAIAQLLAWPILALGCLVVLPAMCIAVVMMILSLVR